MSYNIITHYESRMFPCLPGFQVAQSKKRVPGSFS
jgi:hypothetical protein